MNYWCWLIKVPVRPPLLTSSLIGDEEAVTRLLSEGVNVELEDFVSFWFSIISLFIAIKVCFLKNFEKKLSSSVSLIGIFKTIFDLIINSLWIVKVNHIVWIETVLSQIYIYIFLLFEDCTWILYKIKCRNFSLQPYSLVCTHLWFTIYDNKKN